MRRNSFFPDNEEFICEMCDGYGVVGIKNEVDEGLTLRTLIPDWTCPVCQGFSRGNRTLEEYLEWLNDDDGEV